MSNNDNWRNPNGGLKNGSVPMNSRNNDNGGYRRNDNNRGGNGDNRGYEEKRGGNGYNRSYDENRGGNGYNRGYDENRGGNGDHRRVNGDNRGYGENRGYGGNQRDYNRAGRMENKNSESFKGNRPPRTDLNLEKSNDFPSIGKNIVVQDKTPKNNWTEIVKKPIITTTTTTTTVVIETKPDGGVVALENTVKKKEVVNLVKELSPINPKNIVPLIKIRPKRKDMVVELPEHLIEDENHLSEKDRNESNYWDLRFEKNLKQVEKSLSNGNMSDDEVLNYSDISEKEDKRLEGDPVNYSIASKK